MRAAVIAMILFVLVVCAASVEGVVLCRMTDEIFAEMDAIPKTAAAMENADETALRAASASLAALWERVFPFFTYTVGYTALNRADDAVIALCGYLDAGSYADAEVARRTLSDALRRICENEAVSVSSVF